MTDSEAAYVAGIIEGEGCIDGNASKARYPRIRIQMTDKDVIERVQRLAGGRITKPRKQAAHHKDTWLVTINGTAAVQTLQQTRPWLGERRGAKADALLAASVNRIC